MAHDLRNIRSYVSNDSDYRDWIIAIQAQFAAIGLTRVSTANNVNTATVARPAANGNAGAEIYAFNDSLQATDPIYIRVVYGVGNSADRPRMIYQVGSQATGGGAPTDANVGLAGQYFSPSMTGAYISATAGDTYPSYMCYDGHTLIIATNTFASGSDVRYGNLLWIERPIVAGVRSGLGHLVRTDNYKDTGSAAMVPASGTVPGSANESRILKSFDANNPVSSAGSKAGTEAVMQPALIAVQGKLGICNGVMSYKHADIAAGTAISVTAEATVNYMPLGIYAVYASGLTGDATTTGIAIRWS